MGVDIVRGGAWDKTGERALQVAGIGVPTTRGFSNLGVFMVTVEPTDMI